MVCNCLIASDIPCGDECISGNSPVRRENQELDVYIRKYFRIFLISIILILTINYWLTAVLFVGMLVYGAVSESIMEKIRDWMRFLMPSPAIRTAWNRAQTIVDPPPEPYYQKLQTYLNSMEWMLEIDYVHFITCLMGLLIVIYGCKKFNKVFMAIKGIEYVGEGTIPGSNFLPGPIPSCQLPVYKNDLFSKTFIGYCLRIRSDVIAMPKHVYDIAKGEFLFKGDKWFLMSLPKVDSVLVRDLVYIQMDPNKLTDLKTSVAKLHGGVPSSVAVTVVGQDGVSSGVLQRYLTVGMVMYKGSTKPGYSGAAYAVGRVIYGMHTGMAGSVNIGVSSAVLKAEMATIFPRQKSEASITYSTASEDYSPKELKIKRGWDLEDLVSGLKTNYGDRISEEEWTYANKEDYDLNNWYDQEEYERRYKGEGRTKFDTCLENVVKLTNEELEALEAEIGALRKTRVVKYTPQGVDAQPIMVEEEFNIDMFSPIIKIMKKMNLRIGALEKLESRIQALENKKEEDKHVNVEEKITEKIVEEKPKNQPESPIKKFSCPQCSKAFATQQAMKIHEIQAHFKGESTETFYVEDSKDITKPSEKAAFLENPSHYQTKRPYLRNSYFSVQRPPFSSRQQNRWNTESLEVRLLKSLEKKLEDMVGRSLATQQN